MARVLIIDDDVALGQALTKHLARAGHEVWHSADGDSGIIAAGRHAADVVLVDIFMPGKGGLQTIGRLRRERPAVKIVAMSGVSAGALDVEEHAVALGADRFIRKPFEATSLVSLVATLVAEGKAGSPSPGEAGGAPDARHP
jgi:DNA-binding response OmpR family regulator